MTYVIIALLALAAGAALPIAAFPYVCLALVVLLAAMAWANALEAELADPPRMRAMETRKLYAHLQVARSESATEVGTRR